MIFYSVLLIPKLIYLLHSNLYGHQYVLFCKVSYKINS